MTTQTSYDFFIQWHITERCNLRCLHCYQGESRLAELPIDEITMGIDEIAAMFRAWETAYGIELSTSYNVSGGEPFLRSDIFEILEEINACGSEIFVLSNGTVISAAIARKLAGIGVRGVQVSIEGTEEVHDRIRGNGSFGAAVEGVRRLLDSGIDVTLNATLSTMNDACLPEMIQLAQNLGVGKLGFSRLVPSGRGAEMRGRMLETNAIRTLYEQIFSLDTRPLKIITGDPVAAQLAAPSPDGDLGDVAIGGCAAGVAGLTILADGTITPCRRLNVPIGNITTDSVREVWAASPVLDALRDRSQYKGRCGGCGRWANCRGCRAIAHAYSGASPKEISLADDPQCFIG